MKKIIVLGLTVLLTLSLNAEAARRQGKEHGGKMMECFKKEFNPTPEQLSKVKEAFKSSRGEIKTKRQELRSQREKLKTNMQSDKSDDLLRKDFAEFQRLQSDMMKLQFERNLSVRAQMTPEQRSRFGACQKKRGDEVGSHQDDE